jgi:DNA-directed RNA polymerase subunit H (RpoH/RPB5)
MKLWEQLCVVKKNQIKMMQRRGYTVPDATLLDYTYDQFESYYKQALESAPPTDGLPPIDLFDVLTTEIETPRPALVWYTPQQSRDIPVEDIRDLISYITEDDGSLRRYRTVIIISMGKMSTKISQHIEILEQLNYQHFTYQELMYDPTHHFLYVPHVKLKSNEEKAFLATVKVQPAQLPTILSSDAIVKYHGWSVNSIIRIKRSPVVGALSAGSVFYRRVVQAPVKGEK